MLYRNFKTEIYRCLSLQFSRIAINVVIAMTKKKKHLEITLQ